MKRYFILRANKDINKFLNIKGMNTILSQHYNYVFTEFCYLSPLLYDNEIILSTYIIKKMINSLEYFLKTGKPNKERIYYRNILRDDITLSERVLNQKIEDEYNSLGSPSREYLEEDYEAVKYCLEWLKIGLYFSADLYILNN